MADGLQNRVGLAIFTQRRAATYLRSTMFDIMPALEWIFALSGMKAGSIGIGVPKTGLMISSNPNLQGPMREKIFAERIYHPMIQTTKKATTEVKAMGQYDTTATVSNWSTTNAPLARYTQPTVKFSRQQIGYIVPHMDVRTARIAGNTEGQSVRAIGSVYDSEVKNTNATLMERLRDQLWGINGQSGVPSDETAMTFDSIHSFAAALSDGTSGPGGFYMGVDRTLSNNAYFRGNYVTAAHNGTFSDLIDYVNYDLGVLDKGMAIQLLIVGKELFKKAKAEAKTEGYEKFVNGVPEYPEFGFKKEVVRIFTGGRAVYVVYDPACPSGVVVALEPSTWTVALHPEGNFTVSTPADQTKVEGGKEADTGTVTAEPMIVCEVPKANAYFTNVS